MTSFYTHRKTVKLRIKFGRDAFWIVPRLWAYAAENQPDGDFSKYSSEEIAELIGCPSNAKTMLQALKDCGFVDENGRLHDWKEHNGYHKSFSDRAKNAANARWSKEKSPTPPKEVETGKRKGESGDKHCLSDAPSITAEQIYREYPLKAKKPHALRAINSAMKKTDPARLLEITKAYAKRRNGDLNFVPHPASWFNGEMYNDDPSTWMREDFQQPSKPVQKTLLQKEIEKL